MQLVFPEMVETLLIPIPLMTEEQFFDFCLTNPDLQIERTARGEIIVKPPADGDSGNRNQEICRQLGNWAKSDRRGRAFDSSTGFRLPSGAVMGPDAAWVRNSWLDQLTKDQKRRHLPLCPDFLIELISPSDRRSRVIAKMQQWMYNGAELAWMIDADSRTVTIYRRGQEPQQLDAPEVIVGDGPVEGFRLEMSEIWTGI